jgi:negative regulator of sigma-B (phosphoserine phosphatase)
MATDGIDTSFEAEIHLNEKPQQMADRILSEHFKGNDDALVLVARYLGKQHE